MNFIRFACWIPLLLWIVLNIYVNQFEGWGRWAAAPVLLIPLLTSAAFSIFGLAGVLLNYHRQKSVAKIDVLAALMSGLPVIIVFAKKLI
jgi:hypothetical protein